MKIRSTVFPVAVRESTIRAAEFSAGSVNRNGRGELHESPSWSKKWTSCHSALRTLHLVLALLGMAFSCGAAAPAYYIRQSSPQDTLLASLEALAKSDLEDGFAPFESDTMRGGEPGRHIRINVSGAQEMFLFVTGCPDVKWAVGDWAGATLIGKDGKAISLSDSGNYTVRLGRMEKNLTLRSGLYQKMRLGNRQFDKGLNVQADSVILVPLEGEYERFEAWIGVDAWAGTNGTVRFSVVGARTAAQKRLFELVARDFPENPGRQELKWEREDRIFEFPWRPGNWAALARRYAEACARVAPLAQPAVRAAASVKDKAGMEQVRTIYYHSRELDSAVTRARTFDFEALRLALDDLTTSFAWQYPKSCLARFTELKHHIHDALAALKPSELASYEQIAKLQGQLETLKRDALLANPLLNFDRLLVIKRVPIGGARRANWEGYGYGEFLGIPRQSSWNYGTMPNVDKWTNEIAVLSPVRPQGRFTTLFRPPGTRLVNDIDLHWDADKLLFSMPDRNRKWQVCEIHSGGGGFRQLTPSVADVHNYDAIYLPNGEIIFLSTAPMQGVPCNAGVIVGMMYKMDANGGHIRQLTFEQDHDYTPSILNNGRVLYLRWDYTDTPHIWNRLLMSMNPDGTGQMEYYGANSYWPNAMFFARAIPNEQTKVVCIVTGHHEGRVGDLVILDPAQGRQEADGVVQRIPGRGQKVVPRLEDKLTEHDWPKFLHPWPLNDKYFLVACKPEPDSLWGIYLVDVFDNMTLVKEEEGVALLEPVPLVKRPKPPIIEDKIQPTSKDALVYMEDVYSGPGLRGVPRGTVKRLRLFTYYFAYQKLAGIDHRVGSDGPWEAKRVLGTVPVEADGSALFHVPAKTPISFQPLDAEGKAVALMRSWMTAMPGENVSCVGCHDRQSVAPPGMNQRLALTRAPSEIKPWRGPERGFSFAHEVQPVLDKFCVGCHDGRSSADFQSAVSLISNRQGSAKQTTSNGLGTSAAQSNPGLSAALRAAPDLRRDQGGYVVYKGGEIDGQFIRGVSKQQLLGKYGAVFDPSYVALRKYVRVGGLESDLHLLPPREFSADTSELIQMLQKGHHNVRLDAEAWDRLFTWIDLNAPCHGRWSEVTKIPANQCQRRLELRQIYGGVLETDEEVPDAETNDEPPTPILPEPEVARKPTEVHLAGWPLSESQARELQSEAGPITRTVDLGGGVKMKFARIPAGRFVMGDANGEVDERPLTVVAIDKPFWMAKCEVSNEQLGQFDSSHDSRFEHRSSWIIQPGLRGLAAQWATPTGGARVLGGSDGLLSLALRQTRRRRHLAHRGPVGIRLPRRHSYAAELWRPRHGLLAIRQHGRREPAPTGRRRLASQSPRPGSARQSLQRRRARNGRRRPLPTQCLGPL